MPDEREDVMQVEHSHVEPRPYSRRREALLIGLIAVLGLVTLVLLVVPGALSA
ncbi:hypothetical protein [Rhodococcus phenolicus]|uniref:hypothetical protein n=1 Tax=Rhodococcus phenolicus TaxID=263849 RepID=UPI000AF856DB|nr:hypothetical protein [Rhodococcus phenolicus]